MLSKLDFASCLVYSTTGQKAVSVQSKQFRDRLKRGDAAVLMRGALRTHALTHPTELFAGFFDGAVLVPVPGSAPTVAGGLWVPMLLAQQLLGTGVGVEVAPLLTRSKAVVKSAFSLPADRPNVLAHYASFVVSKLKPAFDRFVLVDDVVTTGATLLAAASRLAAEFRGIDVKAYALMRVISGKEIQAILSPCVGRITPRSDRAKRRP